MYYSELPDCVKYKILRWPRKILEKIKEKHNQLIREKWGDIIKEDLDCMLYKDADWTDCLLLEKTQEDIVEEIKTWVRNNISKLNLETDIKKYILNTLPMCEYVVDFERFNKYFSLLDVYPECFEVIKPKKTVFIKSNKKVEVDIEDLKKIDILIVLDKIGLDYKKTGSDTYALYENWKWTDWWRVNTRKNIVTDFSSKWRPQWNPFNFVSEYYNLTPKDTVLWFNDNWLC